MYYQEIAGVKVSALGMGNMRLPTLEGPLAGQAGGRTGKGRVKVHAGFDGVPYDGTGFGEVNCGQLF